MKFSIPESVKQETVLTLAAIGGLTLIAGTVFTIKKVRTLIKKDDSDDDDDEGTKPLFESATCNKVASPRMHCQCEPKCEADCGEMGEREG